MINLTDENFKNEVLSSSQPVLVDFWAEWCVPCASLAPILEQIKEKFGEKVLFAKVNVDESPLTAAEFKIDRIPTIILFKNGQVIASFVGVKKETEIEEWLSDNLK
jgi:thioredoxin 1